MPLPLPFLPLPLPRAAALFWGMNEPWLAEGGGLHSFWSLTVTPSHDFPALNTPQISSKEKRNCIFSAGRIAYSPPWTYNGLNNR